jgi:hypothetical protein
MGGFHYTGKLAVVPILIADSWISSSKLQKPFGCSSTTILLVSTLLTKLDPRPYTMLLEATLDAVAPSMLSLLSAIYSNIRLTLGSPMARAVLSCIY